MVLVTAVTNTMSGAGLASSWANQTRRIIANSLLGAIEKAPRVSIAILFVPFTEPCIPKGVPIGTPCVAHIDIDVIETHNPLAIVATRLLGIGMLPTPNQFVESTIAWQVFPAGDVVVALHIIEPPLHQAFAVCPLKQTPPSGSLRIHHPWLLSLRKRMMETKATHPFFMLHDGQK